MNEMYIGDYYTETANYKLAHIFTQNSINLYERIPVSEYSKLKGFIDIRPMLISTNHGYI